MGAAATARGGGTPLLETNFVGFWNETSESTRERLADIKVRRGGDDRNTSSGGMFSPRVRVSFAIFLRFSRSLRAAVEVEASMLSDEAVGERGIGGSTVVVTFIRLSMVFCVGRGRSRRRSGCSLLLDMTDLERALVEPGMSKTIAIGGRAPSAPEGPPFRFLLTGMGDGVREEGGVMD